jgi:hypothetical protein
MFFVYFSQTTSIANVGPPNDCSVKPANQSKYQIKAEIHIYHDTMPSQPLYLSVGSVETVYQRNLRY